MVKLMLRNSVQHVIEIVSLAGNSIAQPRLGQPGNRLHQHIVRTLGMSNGLPPRRFRGLWNEREIRCAFRLTLFPGHPAAGHAVPHGNVQHQFPDAVNIRHRLGCGRGGIHILQQLKHCRAMPGIAFKRAAQLFGNECGFGAWGDHDV